MARLSTTDEAHTLGCYEVLGHVDDAVRSAIPDDMTYYVLGGIAGSALESPETTYEDQSQTVFAAEEADKPVFREAGTRRDLDILVDGVLTKKQGKKLKRNVTLAVGGALEASVFGFKPFKEELTGTERITRNIGTFVSQRYISVDGQKYFGMHPIEQKVQDESYNPWMLVTPQGYYVNILHPVGHLLAYGIRSIGGPRPKDAEKVTKSWDNVAESFDIEQLTAESGTFHEWLLFADAMNEVRANKLKRNDPRLQHDSDINDLAAFRAKSRFMSFVENNQAVVDIALHGPAQKVLNVFTGAS